MDLLLPLLVPSLATSKTGRCVVLESVPRFVEKYEREQIYSAPLEDGLAALRIIISGILGRILAARKFGRAQTWLALRGLLDWCLELIDII